MKRLFCMALSLSLLLAACGGQATGEADTASPVPGWQQNAAEPVTLDWYINFSWYSTPWGGNHVSDAITEATGVSINFITPAGSETEMLDALIAADNLPDLVTLGWWLPQLQQMQDAGMVYALNELADEYDAYFWQVADPDRLRWYAAEDGNCYCYPNSSYTPQNYEEMDSVASNETFLVRKDIYEAIGSPDMTTPEGFAQAVRDAAALYPTVDGQPLIPIGAHEFTSMGCDSFDLFLMNFLAIPYEKDGQAYDRFTDPEYQRWLKMFRQLGEEGYLSNDIFIDKRAQMEEKIADGRYFCMLYQRTDMVEQQKARYAADPGSIYIAVDGPRNAAGDPHTLPGSGINGWTVTLISKNCSCPDRAIQFLSYLMSEEGQKLLYLGVEGLDYTVTDGQVELTPATKALYENDYSRYLKEVGGNDAYWMLQDNRMQNQWQLARDPALAQMEEWTYPYTVYTGQYDTNYLPGSQADLIDEQLDALHGQMLPRLLLAPTEEAFDQLWADYCTQRQIYGIDLLLEENTRQFAAAKEKLGIA